MWPGARNIVPSRLIAWNRSSNGSSISDLINRPRTQIPADRTPSPIPSDRATIPRGMLCFSNPFSHGCPVSETINSCRTMSRSTTSSFIAVGTATPRGVVAPAAGAGAATAG
jgi:hypothetical protein